MAGNKTRSRQTETRKNKVHAEKRSTGIAQSTKSERVGNDATLVHIFLACLELLTIHVTAIRVVVNV